MKRMRASRSNIYWAVTFMLISMFMFITQACSSPSTSTSTTTVTTAQASTQTLTTSAAVTTQSTSTKTTTSITQSVSTTTSTGTSTTQSISATTSTGASTPISTTTGQVEATEFQGTKLTPIKDQLLNAIQGTQNINQANYTLTIDGLVDHPITLSYADLEALPQVSELGTLECVEGWSYTAKWTGPSLSAILASAGVQTGAVIAIFYTADDSDGFTSLDLSYINTNNIILALKDNDITLPAANGFPVRVVATGKYGYKWAKWVTGIEVSSNTNFLGYWESNGYNNNGDVNGPAGQ
jgi:DMSO/TMAO reductase YedYZ molybdopterin-dependent catalytic subunit